MHNKSKMNLHLIMSSEMLNLSSHKTVDMTKGKRAYMVMIHKSPHQHIVHHRPVLAQLKSSAILLQYYIFEICVVLI